MHQFTLGVNCLDLIMQEFLIDEEKRSRSKQSPPAIFLKEGTY
jgi:hypothetical protein